uniref:ING domain-containing protein n=1 Tax=Angiostrongylus cantonensis TaxID=6313 RepID=A0A0K0DKU0_ANGCA
LRRQEEGMIKLEEDLDAIRYLVQDYYQAKESLVSAKAGEVRMKFYVDVYRVHILVI